MIFHIKIKFREFRPIISLYMIEAKGVTSFVDSVTVPVDLEAVVCEMDEVVIII